MLIQEFCRATGLGRDTVRFYVKRGLLTPAVGSSPGNRYRVFDEAQVERARLIRTAQRLGFTLRQIGALAAEYEHGGVSREGRARLLRQHLAQIDVLAEQMATLRAYLVSKIGWLEGGENGPPPGLP
ncbi:MAG TPA: MerR family transcriptional regulator [Longimicrobium sp.]|jgi:DNA-binding transcriptional MerR regulator|uniref:MerR family transcriptional regulator n=1 Tax=Longimicrobium sp. TaxID=2029185 RepID=UPI002EDB8533